MSEQKEYTVTGYLMAHVTIKVKADNEEQAKEKALQIEDIGKAAKIEYDLPCYMTDVQIKEVGQ